MTPPRDPADPAEHDVTGRCEHAGHDWIAARGDVPAGHPLARVRQCVRCGRVAPDLDPSPTVTTERRARSLTRPAAVDRERERDVAQLRRVRAEQSPQARLAQVLARVGRLSQVDAARVGRSARSAEEPGGKRPPGQPDPELERGVARVVAAIEDLERLVDVEEGIAPPRNLQLQGTEEKDRELLSRFAGVQAAAVARDHPELGSVRTVYRKRALAGLDGLGLVRESGERPAGSVLEEALGRLRPERRAWRDAA